MHLPTFLKYLALAWGLPFVIIDTSIVAPPAFPPSGIPAKIRQ